MVATLEKGGVLIETVGVFRVSADDNINLTPPGTHPRAVLAAIALSPRRTAARRWLETLVWADRGQEQASGSLRQALSTIRRSLGAYSGIVRANRTDISLDPQVVRVDLIDMPEKAISGSRRGRDLLEGLDVQSEPFEDWLRLERSRLQNLLEAADKSPRHSGAVNRPELPRQTILDQEIPRKPLLFTETVNAANPMAAFFADAISAQLEQTVTEHIRTDVILIDGKAENAILAPGTRCLIRVAELNGKVAVIARLVLVPSGKIVWSRQIAFDGKDDLAALDVAASLAFEVSEIIAANMGEAGDAEFANALAATALKHVFSFDPDRLGQADAILEKANNLDRHAPRPALRALAKAFLSVERSKVDRAVLHEQAEKLVVEALDMDPGNPLALAFIADVYDLVFEDPVAALSSAKRALSINPGTGYAHASLGALELRRNRPSEALSASLRAKNQLANTSLQVFSLMRFCVASMSVGRLTDAARAAEKAALLAPESRPPLRHLYALRLSFGDRDGAREVLRTLQKLEPDFSLSRIRQDPEFPAATLRKTGLSKLQDVST